MWYSWPTQRVRITSKRLAQPCTGSPSSMVVNFVMEDVEKIIQRIWPHLGLTWFSVHGQIILCDTLAHADKRPHAQSCNNEQAHVVYQTPCRYIHAWNSPKVYIGQKCMYRTLRSWNITRKNKEHCMHMHVREFTHVPCSQHMQSIMEHMQLHGQLETHVIK